MRIEPTLRECVWPRSAAASIFALALLASPLRAGGSCEHALLLIDPSSPDALRAGHHYARARRFPDANVLYLDADAASYTAFVTAGLDAFRGELMQRGLEGRIDYVVIAPGTSFHHPASGLVSDACAPVNRFAIASSFTLANQTNVILGGTTSGRPNRYFSSDDSVVAFDSQTQWFAGQPATSGESYFLGALLGYTGERGNTIDEILSMIDRSVAVDGTHPAGTFYFMHTSDPLRSGPRHDAFPGVVASIQALGGAAQILFDVLPLGHHDALGVMTGWAAPDIDGANMTLLPGSFCDHLTSFAGRFDSASQTKMSRWIAKGASATSGTVEEPCNYPGKFPHARVHLFAFRGLCLGEAWFRAMEWWPFQNLFLGDPLTRPFADPPAVDVPDAPGAAVTGTVVLHPVVVATAPGAGISAVELLVDGVLVRRGAAGEPLVLQSAAFADGWHDVRVLAYDDTAVRNVGRWSAELEFANHGRGGSLQAAVTTGDLGTAFSFTLASTGPAVHELRLVQHGRVLAATTQNPGTVVVHGATLGAGAGELRCEAWFADGERVRSAPVTVDVAPTGGGGSVVPLAYGYRVRVRDDAPALLPLAVSSPDSPSLLTGTIVTPPAQGTAQMQGSLAVLLRPAAGASGVDALDVRVDGPGGSSNAVTITIEYVPPPTCPPPTSFCAATVNSTGLSAFIGASGSGSFLANDLELYAVGAVPGQFALFFTGPEMTQIPFGDGFRCVGAGTLGLFRLGPALLVDSFGDVTRPVDLDAPPFATGPGAVLPGERRSFQLWYRDPAAGGSGFNLSNGVTVTFCP